MRIAIIDTSTDYLSFMVSDVTDDREEILFRHSHRVEKHRHARDLFALLDLYAQVVPGESNPPTLQFDAYAVLSGPGSFTGIRVGAALFSGFASGHERPLLGISNLEVVAMQGGIGLNAGYFLCVMPANRNEYYWAGFEKTATGVKRCSEDATLAMADLDRLIDENSPTTIVSFGVEITTTRVTVQALVKPLVLDGLGGIVKKRLESSPKQAIHYHYVKLPNAMEVRKKER